MERILITGGAGFVGSHLARGLRRSFGKAAIAALDNLKRRGSELNIPRLREAGATFIHGDIRNPEDIEEAGPFDLLIECSAEPSVLAGYGGSPRYLINTNLAGTINCLEAARLHKAAVVFLSTSRVYPISTINKLSYREEATRFTLDDKQSVPGVSAQGFSEDLPLAGPRSLYGATKLCSELILQEYIDMYGIKGVINRCGLLTGPWQMGKIDQGVVVLWMARHIYGGALKYIGYGGQGKQVRDMLHVEDLLDLVLRQISRLDALNGRVFNVGGGTSVSASLCEMTAMCQEIAGKTIDIGREPQDRPADIPLYITDNSRVSEATGWKPQRDVRTIFEEIHAWIQDNRDALRPILA